MSSCSLKYPSCNKLMFLSVLSLMGIGIGLYTGVLKTTKEDDVVDEFIFKKEFKSNVYENLDVYTSATAEKITVHGPTNIYGAFDVHESKFSNIAVYGHLTATHTTFKEVNTYGQTRLENVEADNLEVYGLLKAKNVKISEDIMVAGDCSLNNVDVNYCQLLGDEIFIQSSTIHTLKLTNKEKKKVTVHVKNSIIQKIIFDDIKGDVLVYDEDSKVEIDSDGQLKKTTAIFPDK